MVLVAPVASPTVITAKGVIEAVSAFAIATAADDRLLWQLLWMVLLRLLWQLWKLW
jgi:hypothetical protein